MRLFSGEVIDFPFGAPYMDSPIQERSLKASCLIIRTLEAGKLIITPLTQDLLEFRIYKSTSALVTETAYSRRWILSREEALVSQNPHIRKWGLQYVREESLGQDR